MRRIKWRGYRRNSAVPTHLDVAALSAKDREMLEEFPEFDLEELYTKEQIASRVVAAGPRSFRAPTPGGWVFVHPDLNSRGNWRATFFDAEGNPYSHTEFPRPTSEESFEAVVEDLSLDARLAQMEWYPS